MRELADQGVGVVMISSDSHEMAGICDRVIGFDQHGIVGELSGAEVNAHNLIGLSVGQMPEQGQAEGAQA